MKALEIKTKTDKEGRLQIEQNLKQPNLAVRVLILFDEENEDEEQQWLKAIAKNPSFDFLNDPDENIYTLKDGKSLDD